MKNLGANSYEDRQSAQENNSGIDLPLEVQYACEDRLTYRSWIEGDDTKGTDTFGHGTHAAGLLLNVSPHAEIFVARITEKGELNPDVIAEVGNPI